MNKKTIAVLFGGQSSEHEVSCNSASTVISNINKDWYNIVLIGITKEGKWIKVDSIDNIVSGDWKDGKVTAIISPDATQKSILFLEDDKYKMEPVDVIFPVLHGLYGEDGTIQGLFDLARIPYVGCGLLASSVSMDKLSTKVIVRELGIEQAKYVAVYKKELFKIKQDGEIEEDLIGKIEDNLEYPMFVKPSNAGSSKGVSKVYNKAELIEGLIEASRHDKKILVEETIVGREMECAVLGGKNPKASGIGEIIAEADFYDYDAKYNDSNSQTIISPDVDKEVEKEIMEYSTRIFNAVDGYGLARVDFFIENDTGRIIFNEINTMPGFTSISMYSMLWEAKGIGRPQLIEKLIQLAMRRWDE